MCFSSSGIVQGGNVELKLDERNANKGTAAGRALLRKSLAELGAGRSIVVDSHGTVIAGNKTLEEARALGLPVHVVQTDGRSLVVVQRTDLDLSEGGRARALALADNRVGELDLDWDLEQLRWELAEDPTVSTWLAGLDVGLAGRPELEHGSLAAFYGVPPFSVLDARQGYWRERKAWWLSQGWNPRAGLPATCESIESAYRTQHGHNVVPPAWLHQSVFDPVLAEIIYRWWAPPGSSVLDPFAGACTRGAVAATLGHTYTGVEVRADQVAANEAELERCGLAANYVCGAAQDLDALLPADMQFDLVATCPPYFSLERYGGGEADLSSNADFDTFMAWYQSAFAPAVRRLRDNRFLVVVVGDVRGADGTYVGFVPAQFELFRSLGLHLYNELVLVTPCGTAPVRVGRQFPTYRRVVRTHQNVLVFWKGDPRAVRPTLGDLPPNAANLQPEIEPEGYELFDGTYEQA